MSRKLLLVVDGNALVHRAWHALPPLTAPDGRVVSGAYGFMSIFLHAIDKLRPTHIAVTFDLAGPTFRHVDYEAYKANREKKPDELYAQIPIIQEILGVAGIQHYGVSGFEADDVIGTITKIASAADRDLDCIVLTGDMDTLQLVDDRVKVMTLRKGMTDTVLYDAAGVVERYGLTPDQVIDYKALRGDASDNIPGVKGVGEKSATELLQKYGTIEGIFEAVRERPEEFKPAMLRKLEAGEQDAMKAQDLCRIRRDVDTGFNLADTAAPVMTKKLLGEIFRELGFMSLLGKLADSEGIAENVGTNPPQSSDEGTTEYRLLESADEIALIKGELASAKRVSFRSKIRPGSPPYRPEVEEIAFCVDRTVWIVAGEALAAIMEVGEQLTGRHGVCHDLKAERHAWRQFGVDLRLAVIDLQLASYLLDPGSRIHSLNHILARRRAVVPLEKGTEQEEQRRRLALETSLMSGLSDELETELRKHDLWKVYERIESPMTDVLARMEARGVCLNSQTLTELSHELETKTRQIRKRIHNLAGSDFNVNSPAQLQHVLFDELGLSTEGLKKTAKSGGFSTAAGVLERLRSEHEIVGEILSYRELTKLKSTYVDPLPKLIDSLDGRLHASFNQAVTATGRLSSSDPNLQNIPSASTEYGRRVRGAFCARDGFSLLAADYSQIELRIAAHLSGEESMIEAFRSGEDIHYRTAAAMWGEKLAKEKRGIAKVINFGIMYGMGPQMLSENAGISFSEASDYISQYFKLHPAIEQFTKKMRACAAKEGTAETMYGRKRFFRNYRLMDRRERSEAERQAINLPVQGTQADMLKDAMIRLDGRLQEKFGMEAEIIIQVHDELILEVKDELLPEVSEMVRTAMSEVIELKVPIVVNVSSGKNWGDMTAMKK
jgi:DNA polymerase-1